MVEHLGSKEIGDQGLVEVTKDGKILWQWSSSDHINDIGLSERGLQLLREAIARDPNNPWGALEMNSATMLGSNKWYDQDPKKYSVFHPDNIIISYRKANTVGINQQGRLYGN